MKKDFTINLIIRVISTPGYVNGRKIPETAFILIS